MKSSLPEHSVTIMQEINHGKLPAPSWRSFLGIFLATLLTAGPAAASAAEGGEIMELDRIVAVVNDDVITTTELQQQIDIIVRQLRQQRTPLPPLPVLKKQVLERIIVNRIQLQLAAANGIRVDDETLNQTIRRIAERNNLTLAQFRDVIEADGFSFAQFRESMREEIIITRLRQRQVDSRISVSDQEVENFLANQKIQGNANDEYRLGHILIALPEGASPAQIRAARAKAEKILGELRGGADFTQKAMSVSDGQQALSGGDLGWRKAGELPTIFADKVQHMKTGDISNLIRSPSGFHIIKLVDHRNAERHIATQTRARHILIRPNDLTTDEQARELLLQLRERAASGEDFAELARTYSDDKASAVDGGDLGWVEKGKMVPEFEKAMLALQPGQFSDPVKTQFGWHLIEVVDRREIDVTEEFTKNKVREQIYQRKVEEAGANWLRKLRDESYVELRL